MENNLKKIIELRQSSGLTQTELAKLIGSNSNTLSRLEKGLNKSPKVVKKIAEYFQVDYADLIISGQESNGNDKSTITERLYNDMKEEMKFLKAEIKAYREREKFFMSQLGKLRGTITKPWTQKESPIYLEAA